MRVLVNGVQRQITERTTLASLITEVVGSARGSAVVVDGVVVPRSQWSERTMHDGADVELITAVQGG